MTWLERFRRDQRGAGVIELALLAPLLAIMLAGLIDGARGYAAKLKIEQATHRTLEKIATLSSQADYSAFATEAATASGEPVSNVTLEQWVECDHVKQADFSLTCDTDQETDRYVKITIATDFTPNFATAAVAQSFGLSSNGKMHMTVHEAVRVQ